MSQYRRFKIKGACYFFTAVSYQRKPILCCDQIRNVLHDAVKQVQLQMPFIINAWVLMPDHMHCLWTLPPEDANYAKRWGLIKRYVSCRCRQFTNENELTPSQKNRHELSLWQRRFWKHQIRNLQDFNKHMDYIHFNPVKHGLCEFPYQWQWSTIHKYIKKGVYPKDWCGCADDIRMVTMDKYYSILRLVI